jgi:glycosyltransferase involved in cell wall biosynthesis
MMVREKSGSLEMSNIPLDVISHNANIKSHPEISVVIPLFNEVENVGLLYSELKSAMKEMGHPWEVIFVDDGSTDGTDEVLRGLHVHEDGVCVVKLRRNFGQTAAMTAGFNHARGEIIVCLDGDLQNDPQDIARLVNKLAEGYDVVSGWRASRRDGFWLRTLPSRIANWLISRTTGTYLHDYGCTLKAYRAEMIRELRLYGEMHRFIPALIGGNGARIAELTVNHSPRRYGKSKYGISRTVRVVLDLLTVKFLLSFLTKPLQIFGVLGLLSLSIGMVICFYLAVMKIFAGYGLAERPLLLLGVFLGIVGVQFICMGILAEIQTRSYHESSEKRTYSIREVLRPEHAKQGSGAIPFEKAIVIKKTGNGVAADKV